MTRAFLREFLHASLIMTGFVLWGFHAALLDGGTAAYSAPKRVPEALVSMGEKLYQIQPAIAVGVEAVKRGVFPAWTPLAGGGSPLLGKMQNGLLAPLHLPYYVLPLAWLPGLYMLVIFLQAYCGFAFTYLYSRLLGLRFPAATCAGVLYAFSSRMFVETLFGSWGSGLYLPLLLLLVELYFRGGKRLALFLWPLAVAFPLVSGHIESAIRICAVAAGAFVLHLALEKETTWRQKAVGAAAFAVASLVGAGLGACQLVPSSEYLNLSYNKVWRTIPDFGWRYMTFSKTLSGEDTPMLALGCACALAGL
ncbi:MAG: hypothetical protein HYZ74_08035, partial [Elusimicrobia bacterium]|nr:hypothetical protein [Elusimicrobiota bacterium]